MCRLTVYKGKSILLGDLIVKPKNSLVCQSRDAWFHPGVVDREHLRNIRVNGDGFGAAFYGVAPEAGSCVIKFVTPAWSNKNLINLGNFVYSKLIMAHVRAASNGKDPFEEVAVSIENCHPFKYGRWTFMHNGGIPRFHKVKRALLNALTEECFQGLTGSTDSEHIFALFLNFLPDRNAKATVEETSAAIEKTISKILELCHQCGVSEPCSLNLVFSDGVHVYATRFRNSHDSPPSLYYNYGKDFNCETGSFEIHDKNQACEIVVSSAPLSKRCTTDEKFGNWTLMPDNTLLVCVGDDNDLSRISKIYLKPIDNFEVNAVGLGPVMPRIPSTLSMVFDNSIPSTPHTTLDTSIHLENIVGSPFHCEVMPNAKFILQPPCLLRSSSCGAAIESVDHHPWSEKRRGVTMDGPTSAMIWSEEMSHQAPYTGQQIIATPVSTHNTGRIYSVSEKSTSFGLDCEDECVGDADADSSRPRLRPSHSDPALPMLSPIPVTPSPSTPPRGNAKPPVSCITSPGPLTCNLTLHTKGAVRCLSETFPCLNSDKSDDIRLMSEVVAVDDSSANTATSFSTCDSKLSHGSMAGIQKSCVVAGKSPLNSFLGLYSIVITIAVLFLSYFIAK